VDGYRLTELRILSEMISHVHTIGLGSSFTHCITMSGQLSTEETAKDGWSTHSLEQHHWSLPCKLDFFHLTSVIFNSVRTPQFEPC